MNTCPQCRRPLSPRATACPGCGEPGPAAAGPTVAGALAAVNRTDGYAIASFVCSASAFFGTFLFGSVIGIILGKMSKTRLAADSELEGEGLAQTGIVLGWVGIALGLLFLLLGVAMFSSAFRGSGVMHFGF
ncbi:MAG: DUF4190 domain-containing protein [Acidimicrobiia bacterium]